MAVPRVRKNLLKSRRRAVDDGGDEEGSVAGAEDDDSISEGSIISEADDDADAEGSDDTDAPPSSARTDPGVTGANGHGKAADVVTHDIAKMSIDERAHDTSTTANGLDMPEELDGNEINFDDLSRENAAEAKIPTSQQPAVQPSGGPKDRARREHEEYKQRRDADPAFVPNRGGFFMHDHRSSMPGHNGFRPSGRGRGRGRGTGPFPSSRYVVPVHIVWSEHLRLMPSFSQAQLSGSADAPWAHDLHETVTQEQPTNPSLGPVQKITQERQKPSIAPSMVQPPNRSFSGDKHVGNVQIRISLNCLSEPILFSAVPVFQHTRLPHHRPPLRRDKPVRISIPGMPVRYIFPASDRSFIFIPRALRPNQQGFGKIRGRGSFGGGHISLGPLSSRRTSVYAGSGYSPSVAMSRRSSLARELTADGVSPAKASFPRPSPVVRLPPQAQQAQSAPGDDAVVELSRTTSQGPPQTATFHEGRPDSLPMFHPKPERTLQVGDIESPATFGINPPQAQQQQPFHQQVPQLASSQADLLTTTHSRHPSFPSHHGTPLQHIPENAIHAQSFQPFSYQQPPAFYPQHYPPHMYYYPQGQQSGPLTAAAAPPFVPGQPYFYPMQIPAVPHPPVEDAAGNQAVPYESGGMVYYYNPAELSQNAEPASQQLQQGYIPPMGMGGMMTPPMQFYPPPPATFYPQQQPPPPQQ